MRCGLVVIIALAACRQSLPARDRIVPVDVVATRPGVGGFEVVAAELGDDEVVERMRHRVRWRRIGRVSMRADGATDDPERNRATRTSVLVNGQEPEQDLILPVLGEAAAKVRVVIEEDDARIAVWIDRVDAWPTVVAPVRLAAREGDGGVWLEPGAPLACRVDCPVLARSSSGDRPVELRDDAVAVEGWVPGAVIGHVWQVDRDDRSETDMHRSNEIRGWVPPADTRPRRRIAVGTPIRGAGTDHAPVLATVRAADLDVAVVGRRGEFTEIELLRPYMRIRGHVATGSLVESGASIHGFGATGGHGFGMSHADQIDVPQGTCLYDRTDGEVIGVSLETRVRLGNARRGDDWTMVYVDMPWAIVSLYLRDASRDPAHPAWESCTGAAHR